MCIGVTLFICVSLFVRRKIFSFRGTNFFRVFVLTDLSSPARCYTVFCSASRADSLRLFFFLHILHRITETPQVRFHLLSSEANPLELECIQNYRGFSLKVPWNNGAHVPKEILQTAFKKDVTIKAADR